MSGATYDSIEPINQTLRVMRLLADPSRLQMLHLLRDGELNVSELCSHLELAQPTVSHHLALMRAEGLLTSRRSGKHVYYDLDASMVNGSDNGNLRIVAGPLDLRLGSLAPDPQPESKPEPEMELVAGSA